MTSLKIQITSLVFFLNLLSLNSQIFINKTFDFSGTNNYAEQIFNFNNNILISGISECDYGACKLLLLVDYDGNEIWSKVLPYTENGFENVDVSEEHIFVYAYPTDTSFLDQHILLKIDTLGNIIDSALISGNNEYARGIHYNNGQLLITSNLIQAFNPDIDSTFRIRFFNDNLDLIQEYEFIESNAGILDPKFETTFKDETYLTCFKYNPYDVVINTCVFRINQFNDIDLNLCIDPRLPPSIGSNHLDIIAFNENNFIINSWGDFSDILPEAYTHNPKIINIDTLGNIIWEHKLLSSFSRTWYRMSKVSNSDFVVIGNGGPENGNLIGYQMGTITKFNLDGDVLWKKCIIDTTDLDNYLFSEFTDILSSSDGIYYLVGTSIIKDSVNQNELVQNTWLVSIDSSGCFGDQCDSIILLNMLTHVVNHNLIKNIKQVSIFPNPSREYFNIKWKNNSRYPVTDLVIRDLVGREVHTVRNLSGRDSMRWNRHENYIAPGTYLISLYHRGKPLATEKVVVVE